LRSRRAGLFPLRISASSCSRSSALNRTTYFFTEISFAAIIPSIVRAVDEANHQNLSNWLKRATRSADAVAGRLRGFRQGLKETGYTEGENVFIIYRFIENHVDQVPLVAADLISRKVAVVATAGDHVAVLAKSSLGPTPLVFIVSKDPVALGLVNSVGQPGGTVTGINFVTGELVAKRLEILREIVPTASRIAVLVNPANGIQAENTLSDLAAAAHSMGLGLADSKASTSAEIDRAFESIVRDRYDALFVDSDPFFSGRRVHLVTLAMRHSIPTSFPNREAAEVGGLVSYGSDILDAWRQSGVYVGRVLKGVRPMDLPVVDANKFELVINHQTARILGLTIPPRLLARADEVIECDGAASLRLSVAQQQRGRLRPAHSIRCSHWSGFSTADRQHRTRKMCVNSIKACGKPASSRAATS
jgi:putative ABC transport system substrate-binding protein